MCNWGRASTVPDVMEQLVIAIMETLFSLIYNFYLQKLSIKYFEWKKSNSWRLLLQKIYDFPAEICIFRKWKSQGDLTTGSQLNNNLQLTVTIDAIHFLCKNYVPYAKFLNPA